MNRPAGYRYVVAHEGVSDGVFDYGVTGLVWNNIPFRKTHRIEEIGEQCLEVDSTLNTLIDQGVPLTQYAWEFRYPGDIEEPAQDESEEAHK